MDHAERAVVVKHAELDPRRAEVDREIDAVMPERTVVP